MIEASAKVALPTQSAGIITRNARCFTVFSSIILSNSFWNMRTGLRDTMVTSGLLFRKL